MYKLTQKLLFAHFNDSSGTTLSVDLVNEKMPYIILGKPIEIYHPACYSEKIGLLTELHQQHLMMVGDMMVITGGLNKDDLMDASRQYIAVIKLTLEDHRTPKEKEEDRIENERVEREHQEIEARISKAIDKLLDEIKRVFPLN